MNKNPIEVIGAIIAVKEEDSQTSYKDDNYKYMHHINQEFQDILNMVNQGGCARQSISKRIFLESTLFTRSEPIYTHTV